MKEFELVVVTPERTSFQGKAVSLSLPAWEGSLGVLPGHAPALILLQEGLARARTPEGQEEILAVCGGFAEISPTRVTLFAETAELGEEVDAERARLSAERAKADIAKFRRRDKDYQQIDIDKAQASLRRALTRLKVVQTLTRVPRRSATPRSSEQ